MSEKIIKHIKMELKYIENELKKETDLLRFGHYSEYLIKKAEHFKRHLKRLETPSIRKIKKEIKSWRIK